MSVRITPYELNVPDELLTDLHDRLRRTRWPQSFPEQGWDYGTNTDFMRSLVDYWLNDFDWRKQEAAINQYEHFKAQVDDVGVHFMHIPGKGPDPTPLLMLHGYPWSWATFLRIIPLLTDPTSYGGAAEDSFSLVIPSLCGFCLSDQVPRRGFGFQHHPPIYNAIMQELGYERYGLYGGDWGGIITFPYGHQFPEQLLGIHLNYMGQRMRDERPPDECDENIIRGFGLFNAPIRPRDSDSLKFWKAAETFWMEQSGYSHVNMTCPQSFAHLVSDSPVGAAAWIVEKYHQWSDWNETFEEVFTKDDLLTNIMLYWINNTFGTAIRIYYESHYTPWKVKPGNRIEVPTAILSFPKDIVPLLKSRAEAYYNVRRFKYMERGGHFGIFECAEDYAVDLRAFFNELKTS
ncbi:MAG: epoxide hydrolase [Pirellulaceae bacterium]|nr:epoxide hydrolase [Pirellulaceae bacterium]